MRDTVARDGTGYRRPGAAASAAVSFVFFVSFFS
jgi:hypothetical protein